jgi:hypothetical protein
MDIIKKIVKLNYQELNHKIEQIISKSIDTRKLVISGSTSNDNKIKILIDDTYTFNLYSNCIYLKELKCLNKEERDKYIKLGDMLKNYNIVYNTDIDLLKVIIELYAKTDNNDKKFFLLKTIKSMEKFGTCSDNHDKILNITKNMDHAENIIGSILDRPLKIDIDRNKIDAESESIVSSVYPNKQNFIYIDKSKYYYLVKKISDKNVRNHLEKEYMKRYNELIPAISKLIGSRNVYSNLLGHESFYKFTSKKSDDDTENLKVMLKDLNEKLDSQLETTIENIKLLTNNNDKLTLSDMIYGLNKFFPDIKLKPIDILQIAFVQIQSHFKIRFSESKVTPLNKDCNGIEVYDYRDRLRGYIFLDLLKNNKNIKQLTLLKLAAGYGENLPVLYLMGAFTDLEKPICSYSDVVTIFRELGHVITNIFSYSPLGASEDDIELINFMPDLMEYMAYNPQIILSLVKDRTITKRIIKARENEILINLKLKCINVLFDSIIHSSQEFLNINKKANNSNNSSITPTKVLLDLYKRVYTDIFSKLGDKVNCDIGFILPNVIHNIINGQQSLIYGNVLSMILAYNAYESLSKNDQYKKIYDLLENKNYSYKKNLIKFILTINEDYYKNFLYGCLKIKDLSHDNYFDEGNTENRTDTIEEMH